MDSILKTVLLEHEKSSFLNDLVKYQDKNLYVRITQTIQIGKQDYLKQEIKINPGLLTEIMEVLSGYQNEIPQFQVNKKDGLTEENIRAIQTRYLKGIEIKDLAIQFNCKEELIKQVLNNRGIKIVSNKPEKKPYWKWRRKKG